MLPPLLLLLCLSRQMLAKTPPDVQCLVMNMENVQCSWNKNGIPEVNYTFSSRFFHETETNCSEYLLESGTNIGCIRPYNKKNRFHQFYTTLTHGSEVYHQDHEPAMKVKLKPPVNLSVKEGSDFNLWFYWNHTHKSAQSKVRYRKNNNNWEFSNVDAKRQYYCIQFPSNRSRYELQVQSKYGPLEDSEPWSDWSEPVAWGFNNSSNTSMLNELNESMSVWTPVHYVVGVIVFILLVLLLLKHERLRIIFISVVPKPSLKSPDMKDWFQFPKGLTKEDFKASYTDQACPVCEYTYGPPSDSSRCNTPDLTGGHDDCSVTIAENESEEPSSPDDSSDVLSEEEKQVLV